MSRIPSDAPPSIQAAFREIWNELQKPRDLDLKGNRITNAGPGLIGTEYVTRRQMREYVQSQDFAADVNNITVNGGGFGTHGLLSPTHYDTNTAGATRGDLIVANSGALWARLAKGAANTFLRSDGTDLGYQAVGWSDDATTITATAARLVELLETANGAKIRFGTNSEVITLNTGGTTTDSVANLLPADSLILFCHARVLQTITTATLVQIGTSGAAARFHSPLTQSAGSAEIGIRHWRGSVAADAGGPSQTAADKVRITCNANPGAGQVRVTMSYLLGVAPTS